MEREGVWHQFQTDSNPLEKRFGCFGHVSFGNYVESPFIFKKIKNKKNNLQFTYPKKYLKFNN